MRRSTASLALTAFSFCSFVPLSFANVCVGPRIKSAQACGYVVDPFGESIPNAEVHFYMGIDTIPAKADVHGFFVRKDLPETKFLINISAAGFQDAATNVEIRKPGKNCSRPFWVMLDLGMDACSVVATRLKDLPLRKRGIPSQ